MGVAGAQLPQGCKPMGLGDAPQLCGSTLTTAAILVDVAMAALLVLWLLLHCCCCHGCCCRCCCCHHSERDELRGKRGCCSCAETAHRNGAPKRREAAHRFGAAAAATRWAGVQQELPSQCSMTRFCAGKLTGRRTAATAGSGSHGACSSGVAAVVAVWQLRRQRLWQPLWEANCHGLGELSQYPRT